MKHRQELLIWKWCAAVIVAAIVLLLCTTRTGSLQVDNLEPSNGSLIVEPMEYVKKPKSIQQISILGERNSGTTWIYEHIGLCFNHSIPVRRRLSRYKHWFQFEDDKIPDSTLVISLFRDPIYWVDAMIRKPHHATSHIDLPWKQFVTQEWTMERVGLDLEVNDTLSCQEQFQYHEVVSCNTRPFPKDHFGKETRWSEHQPFYEMRNDGSGEPYDNIFQFRADKILNFLSTQDYANVFDTWTIQYEYLLKYGTFLLVENIEEVTGIKAQCNPWKHEPQDRAPVKLDKDFVSYVTSHLDWEVEKVVGYTKKSGETYTK